MTGIHITAVIICLREQDFIEKCLTAIYPFVQRIIVVSNYDSDYYGRSIQPDLTVQRILDFDDPDKKLVLMVNRRILDETVQRNWAMDSDADFFRVTHRRFSAHAHSLSFIKEQAPKTDYFWIIDADEIYDPQTIPAAIDFVKSSKSNAVAVKGHNFFGQWNYRLVETGEFRQIGFLSAGQQFFHRRRLYYPRPLGWTWRISTGLSRWLINSYWGQTSLPESVATFCHGSYVGDEQRIRNKLLSHSHATEIGPEAIEQWIQTTWRNWTPQSVNLFFSTLGADIWRGLEHVPTEELPGIIRDSVWPAGWIELPGNQA